MRKGFPEDARKIVDGIYQLRRNILIYLNQQGRRTLQEISGYVGCDEGDVAAVCFFAVFAPEGSVFGPDVDVSG